MNTAIFMAGAVFMGALAPDRLVTELSPVADSAVMAETLKVAGNDLKAVLEQVSAVLRKGDPEASREALLRLTAHEDFPLLEPEFRFQIWYTLMVIERENNNPEQGYDYGVKAGEASPESRDADYWMEMVLLPIALGKATETTDAFIQFAEQAPDRVGEFKPLFIIRQAWHAQTFDDNKERFSRLLKALHNAGFEPDGPDLTAEFLWAELFHIYMQEGNEAAALSLLPFEYPQNIQAIRVRKDYRELVEADPAQFDYGAATARQLHKYQTDYEAEPTSVHKAQSLAFLLYLTNQPEAALTVVNAAIALPRRNLTAEAKDYLPWLYDTRSRALNALGRHGEAEAALLEGRKLAEKMGNDKVSLTLNIVNFYALQGQPEKAVKALGLIDAQRASDYGRMVEEAGRACTYVQMGETEKLEKAVAHLKANARHGYGPALDGLLCVDEQDAVADIIIEAMASEPQRGGILKEVQTYLAPPYQGKMEAEVLRRREAVLARPDVREAIEAHGIIESYPVFF